MSDRWLQQGDVTETMYLLQNKIPDRIISRSYLLWGYVKDGVYAGPIESITVLKLTIPGIINGISTKQWLKMLMKDSAYVVAMVVLGISKFEPGNASEPLFVQWMIKKYEFIDEVYLLSSRRAQLNLCEPEVNVL